MILTKTQKYFQKCQVFYRVIENNSNFLVGATGSPKRGTPKRRSPKRKYTPETQENTPPKRAHRKLPLKKGTNISNFWFQPLPGCKLSFVSQAIQNFQNRMLNENNLLYAENILLRKEVEDLGLKNKGLE